VSDLICNASVVVPNHTSGGFLMTKFAAAWYLRNPLLLFLATSTHTGFGQHRFHQQVLQMHRKAADVPAIQSSEAPEAQSQRWD
jgi:hypothetical protein